MSNPLFKILGGGQAPQQMPGPLGNMANLAQQFQQFKANFKGDPRQEVQRLLDSGQMSQQQYNELRGMAQQFMNMLRL
jgi:hypothetical protein